MCLSVEMSRNHVWRQREDRNYDRNKGRNKYHSPWDTNPHRLKYRPC